MLRYKLNKQPFIIAALVILLCFACLSGATLALFTSDPNNGSIGIIATTGSIDIDIVDANNVDQSLVGMYLEFQVTAENHDYRFEPGAIIATQDFKVRNRGVIPVNFRLSVSEPTDGSLDMDKFNEAFEVWIVKKGMNLTDAQKPTEFVESLGGNQCSDAYILMIRMKETAGEEFKDCWYSGIGVTVYAVQGNVGIEE